MSTQDPFDTSPTHPAAQPIGPVKQINRQRLLDAGWTQIQSGNWRITVNGIAEAAGMSGRSFYYHFTGLDNYLTYLVQEHQADMYRMLSKYTPLQLLTIVLKGSH